MTDIANLWRYDLRRGNTDHPRNGACLYDAANWIIYGTVGDDPPSACPVIRTYAFCLNDLLPDDERQRLKPFILRVVGNRDPQSEQARAEYLVQRIANVITPMALEATGLTGGAIYRGVPLVAVSAARAAAARAFRAEVAIGAADWQDAAEYAADAVYAAAKAVWNTDTMYVVYDAAIETLDGALKIGKQADPFDEETVRRAVVMFDLARCEVEPAMGA